MVGRTRILLLILLVPAVSFGQARDPDTLVRALASADTRSSDDHRDPDLYRAFVLDHLGDEAAAAEVRTVLEAVVRNHPRLREAWFGLGFLGIVTGDWTLAEDAAKRALEVSPGWGLGLNLLGATCFEQGRLVEAERSLLAASRADPTLPFPYTNLFRLSAQTDRCSLVTGAASAALADAPVEARSDVLDAIRQAAWNMLGTLEQEGATVSTATCLRDLASLVHDPALEAGTLAMLASAGADVPGLLPGFMPVLEAAQASGNPSLVYEVLKRKCAVLDLAGLVADASRCHEDRLSAALAVGDGWEAYGALLSACFSEETSEVPGCGCADRLSRTLETSSGVAAALALKARGDCLDGLGDKASANREWELARKRFVGLLSKTSDGRVPSFLGDIEQALGLHDDAVRSRRVAIQRFLANPDSDPGRIFLEREFLVAHLGVRKRYPEALVEARLLVDDYERLDGRVTSRYGPDVMTLVDPNTCSDASLEVSELKLRMLAVGGTALAIAEEQVDRVACLRLLERGKEAAAAVRMGQAAFAKVSPDWEDLVYAEVACDVAYHTRDGVAAEKACLRFLELARRDGTAFKVASATSRLADAAELNGDTVTWERRSIESAERFQAAGIGELAGSTWIQVALDRLSRGEHSAAAAAAQRALEFEMDDSSAMRAGLVEAQALAAQGRWPQSRKRFEELIVDAGHDPVLWEQILGSAWGSPEVEVKRLVINRFDAVRGRVRFPPRLAVAARARCISLEAHATGRFVEALEQIKALLQELDVAGDGVPEVVLLTANELAVASGDVAMSHALTKMRCDGSGGDPKCEAERTFPALLSSALLGSGRLAALIREGRPPSRKELLEVMREDVLPVMELDGSGESADAIPATPGQSPVASRHRTALRLAWTHPERALGLLDEALALLPDDAPASARLPLLLQAGTALANMDRRADAVVRFREAEHLARNQGDAPHRHRDMMVVASTTVQAGICDEFAPLREDVRREFSGERRGWTWVSFRMDDMRCQLDGKAPLAPEVLEADLAEFRTLAPQLEAMGLVALDVAMRLMFAVRFEASGRTDEAIELLREAVEGVEHAATTAQDPAEQARMFQGFGRVPFDLAILLLLQRGGPGDAEEALRLSERTRSIELLNELGRKGIRVASRSLPRGLMDRQEGVMGRLALARAERTRLGLELPWEDQRLAVADKRVEDAEAELASFAEEVWRTQPLYASVRFPRPLDMGRIPLSPDELLVEYRLLPGGQFVVWLVNDGQATGRPRVLRARKVQLSPGVLDEVRRVREWQSAPRRDRRDAMRPLTGVEELARVLVGDLLEHAEPLRHRRLLVVADDVVQGIPVEVFDLGHLGGCRGPGARQGTHLSDCFSIEYQPSIATFSVARTLLPTKTNRGQLLALADPVFSSGDPRLGGRGALETTGVRAAEVPVRLPSTGALAEEARSRLCPGGTGSSECRVLVGPDAVEDAWVRLATEGYRVLHLSTHTGTVGDAMGPGRTADQGETALLLSLAVLGEADNRLSRSEIMSLDLVGTELAVLAGCESAGGNDTLSEGVAGLAAAFLRAGTRQVIGSLWPVDEQATTALMDAFYAGFAATGDAAESLARARRTLRADTRWDAPFFWAGFVLFGPSPMRGAPVGP